ncbi:MAG: 4Fe-4S dicluster domain-containing protein [Lachnospiraceae bacterium]|nr:4Fe-4S dicluster domain-containing protein [Lachnospiraceae bacterium]
MGKIILFKEKSECCGCGACMNICPKGAITMVEDEVGFVYPSINSDKCIGCGLCKKACNYQRENQSKGIRKVYAAMTTKTDLLTKSASGGIFASIAENILDQGGIVVGVSMEQKEGTLYPQHVIISSKADLEKLQGSKYVQSEVGYCYKLTKELLNDGRTVLFTGTPCQIDGLYGYLRGVSYPDLYTIDIICHGVPSCKFFQSYLQVQEKKVKGKIVGFKFRDKECGWGLQGSMQFINKRNKKIRRSVPFESSSYYQLFLNADIYRENCYECKYATKDRIGDLTIGDYWRIEKEHPEYLIENGGTLEPQRGISSILVNSEQGEKLLKIFGTNLILELSNYDKVSRQNAQLRVPSSKSKYREEIFETYKKQGYQAIEKEYDRKLGIKKYRFMVSNMVPKPIKTIIKRII